MKSGITCPCCGHRSIAAEYELCKMCGWIHDRVQESDPDSTLGANPDVSLRQAQRNFIAIGACHPWWIKRLFGPKPVVERDPEWTPLPEAPLHGAEGACEPSPADVSERVRRVELASAILATATWGPFATAFHQAFADAAFRDGVRAFVEAAFVPRIPFEPRLLEAAVFTRYNDERFVSPISMTKYCFTITCRAMDSEHCVDICANVRSDRESKAMTLRPHHGMEVRRSTRATLAEWAAATQRLRTTCPCCGYSSLSGDADYTYCDVCDWFNDYVDETDGISLDQARANFVEHGCMYPPGHRRHETHPEEIERLTTIERLWTELQGESDAARTLWILKRLEDLRF